MPLYQVYNKLLGDEHFCFNADNDKEATLKYYQWIEYHSHTPSNFRLKRVAKPKYQGGIHDEHVSVNP
jgi:hypothetical protein